MIGRGEQKRRDGRVREEDDWEGMRERKGGRGMKGMEEQKIDQKEEKSIV